MKLWPFRGGLRLPQYKTASSQSAIVPAPIPPRLVIPLQSTWTQEAQVLVAAGERVLTGQPIARTGGEHGVAVHATSSGVIAAIEQHPIPHPSGIPVLCALIDTDGRDEWDTALPAIDDYRHCAPALIRQRSRDSGIVGLGGAAFPSAVKLGASGIRQLVLNGVECEPYITCDDRLMQERPERVVGGLLLMRQALGADECLIAVEDNKPNAFIALQAALAAIGDATIRLVRVPSRYPAGGERQLIYTLTGKEVPSGGLPADIGVLCHNVGTAAAVYEAVVEGRPLISRVVTVTGPAAVRHGNYEVRLGTPMAELIRFSGGYGEQAQRLIMGGPMMGFTIGDDRTPLTQSSNCLLLDGPPQTAAAGTTRACIRCGACHEACPAGLLPQQLYWHTRGKDFEQAEYYGLFDCIECGCCDVVCPSHIPLVQHFRYAKSELWTQQRERQKAELARERYEFRNIRLEREKEEQAKRREAKKAALKKAQSQEGKKAAIQAALARAKQKKTQQSTERND
ncbi:electron transport complex subunit RsxC [Alkalilimnicola ehrlichii]|uniref:Ion-translocating oxidoreductase complex subunit C n=1 Tax=Alkalilimnicola ehrlichii TaxID=351052 RepID=A0A3E0WGU6_9GAMM|nr:electron transport complex subunit RsxC [Alkalilimnicola ehrlichii]RFA31669.1 electron transport complex subunit RsxC [Alkalilimnicola ehrlichii]